MRKLWCLIVSPAPFAAPHCKWRFNRASKKCKVRILCLYSERGWKYPLLCFLPISHSLLLALHIWMNAKCRRISCSSVLRHFIVAAPSYLPSITMKVNKFDLTFAPPNKLTPLPTPRLLPHNLLAEAAAQETCLCWFRTFAFCLSLGFNCNFIFRFPGKNFTHSDF